VVPVVEHAVAGGWIRRWRYLRLAVVVDWHGEPCSCGPERHANAGEHRGTRLVPEPVAVAAPPDLDAQEDGPRSAGAVPDSPQLRPLRGCQRAPAVHLTDVAARHQRPHATALIHLDGPEARCSTPKAQLAAQPQSGRAGASWRCNPRHDGWAAPAHATRRPTQPTTRAA
jgi:hypothetical protein